MKKMKNKQFDPHPTIEEQKLIRELVASLKENVMVFGKLNKPENFDGIIVDSCMLFAIETILRYANQLKKIEDISCFLNECLDTFKINIEKIREAFISH